MAPVEGDLIKTDREPVYKVVSGKRRWMRSADEFGHRWDLVTDPPISLDEMRSIPLEVIDGHLIRGSGDPVYLIIAGQRRWIPSEETLLAMGFEWASVLDISDAQMDAIPGGPQLDRQEIEDFNSQVRKVLRDIGAEIDVPSVIAALIPFFT